MKYNIHIWKYIKEKRMVDITVAYVVFGFCMLGAALTAFHLGRREGIEGTVQYLIDAGVLEVDDEHVE